MSKTSVLFVCLGNICRSPLAQGVFENKLENKKIAEKFFVDSCGTGSWHVGEKPHKGSIAIARQYGVNIENQRARDLNLSDFKKFEWIIAMDSQNLRDIESLASDSKARIHLLREFDTQKDSMDVPDPYYTGGFQQVFDIIDRSCDKLLERILRNV
jgi:protein-tyrosine phosphatase